MLPDDIFETLMVWCDVFDINITKLLQLNGFDSVEHARECKKELESVLTKKILYDRDHECIDWTLLPEEKIEIDKVIKYCDDFISQSVANLGSPKISSLFS